MRKLGLFLLVLVFSIVAMGCSEESKAPANDKTPQQKEVLKDSEKDKEGTSEEKEDESLEDIKAAEKQKAIEIAESFTKEFYTLKGRKEGEIGGMEYVEPGIRDSLRQDAYDSFGLYYNEIVNNYGGPDALFEVAEAKVKKVTERNVNGHTVYTCEMEIEWAGEHSVNIKSLTVDIGYFSNIMYVVGIETQ